MNSELKTQLNEKLKVGDIFRTSWGYDQTNYDFLVIVGFTKSEKSAYVRMSKAKRDDAKSGRGYDALVPTGEPYGDTFRMKITDWTWGGATHKLLRGSYPYLGDGLMAKGTRLDSFSLVENNRAFHQTASGWGH